MTQDKDGNWHESPVHNWFELSYASYLTLPRSVMEAMPYEWQVAMVALLEEADETLDWDAVKPNGKYEVRVRDEHGLYRSDPLRNYRHPMPIPLKQKAARR